MNLKVPELLIILGIVLLLFGARKLPDLAASMGRSIREFRKASDDPDADAAAAATGTAKATRDADS